MIPDNVKMIEVDSSNIKAIGHDGVFTLYIHFKSGGVYEYMNVGKEIFEAFKTAPSMGRFFHASINHKYPFRRLDVVEVEAITDAEEKAKEIASTKPEDEVFDSELVAQVQWLDDDGTLSAIVHKVGGTLARATPRSAAFDLTIAGAVQLPPGQRALVGTGIKLAMPDCLAAFILPRSGLAKKLGISVTNSPGLIDPDYRGEIGVILENRGDTTFVANEGDRIAQIMFVPFVVPKFVSVKSLDASERGEGGFGSTGVSS